MRRHNTVTKRRELHAGDDFATGAGRIVELIGVFVLVVGAVLTSSRLLRWKSFREEVESGGPGDSR